MNTLFRPALSLLLLLTSQVSLACLLTIGVVPQFEQRKLLEIWQPIMDQLSQATECRVDLAGSENIPDFEAKFMAGRFDIAYMNPYHAVMAHAAQGYEPFLRSKSNLQGVLVVKDDSPIKDVSELQGQPVAFPSPNALGASLLMRAELKNLHGVDVDARYVNTHPSVYLHVAKGLTVAGGGVQKTFDEQPQVIRDRLRVLYSTRETPSHPLVIHPRLGKEQTQTVIKALTKIASEQPALFDAIPMPGPTATTYRDYQPLEELHLEQFQH
ncbi:phosphate/phosphite/phosphonate ABC transporter substrate-binding protein [Parathalassolituus penaei]|uniref:Phosphate/phosphite/phosphonate ABC transporter substrate-binding protein n=1 Tax=Parathalassolituus penaei TaxID=2997323 RepID=A0A9X3EIP6_9GAMM|nr:phosphate/phosphite/phosphonate ABC transporter substrate-binding protein [Parathalassolituus penaei]MCY0967435.1 phosphate/phosphite/phosphonate ABC transporter substrate-binding protein [Parathalassolituus penaei]